MFQAFFTFDSCANGFAPRRNDAVKALCVESSQGSCQWRAAFVLPLSRNNTVYRYCILLVIQITIFIYQIYGIFEVDHNLI